MDEAPERPTTDPSPRVTLGRGRAILVALALGCVSFAVASPGLLGTWVYDDMRMVDNPLYDGWDDVAVVFERTSADYFRASGEVNASASQTYRPLTMATLIATHAASPTPLAHHLVGWVLHLLIGGALWLTLRAGAVRTTLAGGLTALFVLHPVGVEAYVWINGRSDVCAALGVMLTALGVAMLMRGPQAAEPSVAASRPGPQPRRSLAMQGSAVLGAGLLSFLTLAAKETSLAALGAVWLAGVLRGRREGRAAVLGLPACGAACGVGAYLTAWSAVRDGAFGSLGPGSPPLSDPDVWHFVPKLMAIGAGALTVPRTAPMQSFVWLATRPLTPVEWGGAALAGLLVVFLLRARDLSGLALVAGAACTLLPTAVLVDVIWLGLDRYLYVPLLLVLLAVAPHLERVAATAQTSVVRLVGAAAAALVLVAALHTYGSSAYYESHPVWMASGVEDEPNDPTRYLMMAKELMDNGHPEAARSVLTFLPPPPWPRAIVLGMLEVTHGLADDAAYDAVLARAEASHVDHPGVQMHRVHRALRRGELAAALELVPALGQTDVCPELAGHLRAAASRYQGADREALRSAFVALPCVRAPTSPSLEPR